MSSVDQFTVKSPLYIPDRQFDSRFTYKFSPDFPQCYTGTCSPARHTKSASSSTCHSDDSGIERTLNLSSTSPLPEDTDSDEGTSLNAVHYSPNRRTGYVHLLRPLVANVYNDIPLENCNVAQTAQFSPSGTCNAATRDTHSNDLYTEKLSNKRTDDNRFHILSREQVEKLHHLLTKEIPICSRNPAYPTIWVRLSDLFQAVQENLKASDIPVRDMRLNGGAASHVIGMDAASTYNDIDVLISVDLSSSSSTIQRVKTAVLDALTSFIRENQTWSFPAHERFPRRTPIGTRSKNSSQSTVESGVVDDTNVKSEIPLFSLHTDGFQSHTRSNGQTELENVIDDVKYKTQTSVISQSTDSGLGVQSADDCSQISVDGETNDLEQEDKKSSYSATSGISAGTTPEPFSYLPFNEFKDQGNLSKNPSIDGVNMRESYVYKQFRKYSTHDTDCWSLLSLGIPSAHSKVIEFKFVDRMRRQFEFTVDSFQVLLGSMLSFIKNNPHSSIKPNFYPTVVAESVAGSFSEAFRHLKHKLILTTEPEMIRGGGLLKYCRLLVNGYQAPDGVDICSLERYMSSRFFIDFQDIDSQKAKLEAFLENHFTEDDMEEKIQFLQTVYRVVSGSTICLMSYERYQTLNLIFGLLQQTLYNYQCRPAPFSLDWFAEQQNLVLDKVYFGSQLFPVIACAKPDCYSCSHCDNSSDVHYSPETYECPISLTTTAACGQIVSECVKDSEATDFTYSRHTLDRNLPSKNPRLLLQMTPEDEC
ncbi:unnamed protein product [Calicophoron daubneyi]|uniref:polynucleotide adenylyltransferase n=1 Tax=Calicophoron daubneyi TaxID=300641 RepID=A0AAV2T4W2_CALDB